MKRYSQEFKDQIIQEVKDVGNASAVAKKHGLNLTTVHTWVKKEARLPMEDSQKKIKQLEKQLADKDLENQILKELLKKTNKVWLGRDASVTLPMDLTR